MTRNQALMVVSASVLVGLLIGALWIRRPTGGDGAGPGAALDEAPQAAVAGAVTLYFPGADGRLHAEVRALDTNVDGSELVRRIVASLLGGPDDAALFRPLPESTAVGSAFLAGDGTLYLDLVSSDYPLPPVVGSQRELLAAYSLVNSVCANVPRIRGVALLWNSEQHTTFAGNLDTTRPLTPNRRLVAAAS